MGIILSVIFLGKRGHDDILADWNRRKQGCKTTDLDRYRDITFNVVMQRVQRSLLIDVVMVCLLFSSFFLFSV